MNATETGKKSFAEYAAAGRQHMINLMSLTAGEDKIKTRINLIYWTTASLIEAVLPRNTKWPECKEKVKAAFERIYTERVAHINEPSRDTEMARIGVDLERIEAKRDGIARATMDETKNFPAGTSVEDIMNFLARFTRDDKGTH